MLAPLTANLKLEEGGNTILIRAKTDVWQTK